MNFQAKLTPTGTELLKEAPIQDRPVSPTHHPNDELVKRVDVTASGRVIGEQPAEPIKKDELPDGQPLKVAIIGTAPSSRLLAPFNDPSWKIWACSPGNKEALPRVDEWFEIHINLLWPECASYGAPYIEWLRKQIFPIWMQNNTLVSQAKSLPKDQLIKEFGPFFFTSSFAFMMAFAILRGAKEIALFGVDMASKDEYILQRPGGHFFMWEAAKRGIRVSAPAESDLCQPPPLYGYADGTPFGRKMYVRDKELETRIGQMTAQRDQLNHSITYLQGAREDMDYMRSIWSGVQLHN